MQLAWAALIGASLLVAAEALARPGGGHTFGGSSSSSRSSGGGRSGGGGGGGGDAELLYLLVRLVFAYPKVGVPLVLVVLFLIWRAKNNAPQSWTSSHVQVARPEPARAKADVLRAVDPDFSLIVLEDFAYRLFASAQRARSTPRELDALAPYLDERVRKELAGAGAAPSHVVVGSLRLERVSRRDARGDTPAYNEISLLYEANLSYGAERTEYVKERWTLHRAADARTKPPAESERLGCPNCGAPFSSSDGRRCAYCNEVVSDGKFAWVVVARGVLALERRPPALAGDVAERGTDDATIFDPDVDSEWRALCAKDPQLDEKSVEARLRHIYDGLNRAWSACELSPLRPLVTDGMYDYLRYWVEAYQRQGLRNVLKDMRMGRVERVKVVRDVHFDALTVRFWAAGLDTTVDVASGALRSGSPEHKRAYSEYWTLVRSSAARGKARTDASCPSCAAPLDVSMAGTCKHCGSHLTRGEFDWVLSKIEQDDVYEG